jgi:hypothetical protein
MTGKVFRKTSMILLLCAILIIGLLIFGCENITLNKKIEQQNNILFCKENSDCLLASYEYSCCPNTCPKETINKLEYEKREKWISENCEVIGGANCQKDLCEFVKKELICKNSECMLKITNFNE